LQEVVNQTVDRDTPSLARLWRIGEPDPPYGSKHGEGKAQ
jgi:hypothetical protein